LRLLSLTASLAYPKLTQFVIDDVIGHRRADLLTPVMLGLLGAFLLRESFQQFAHPHQQHFRAKRYL